MTYCIIIDQQFAKINGLTLVQVSTLAAFMTLPLWAKNVAMDGKVWYQYSDEKMTEDFPLLFGIPKRCYKNIVELAELGFVELTKIGRAKFVRFTEKCADWNKEKVQKWTNSPKSDSEQSEIGLKNSPKLDFSNNNYNINNSEINTNIAADGGLFPVDSPVKKKHLFADSPYFDFSKFASRFEVEIEKGVDVEYYYNAVADWSASNGRKKVDWIATARTWMRKDMTEGKLRMQKGRGCALSEDAMKYLREMSE